jgi:DNA methyltransferase 1-associated protein 1
MEYSQFEYDQHLADPQWTAQETGYLFQLLRDYDLRFVVAADRYGFETSGGISRRSVEVRRPFKQ